MNSVLSILTYIAARAREPSTWAGISVIAAMFHVNIPPDAAGTVSQVIDAVQAIVSNASTLIALAGSIYAVVVPDRSASQSQTVESLASTVQWLSAKRR